MENHIEKLSNVVDVLVNVPIRIKYLNDELVLTNAKQTDLLHEIENNNFNAYEGYMKAKELQEIRMYRRELKNELEILDPFYKWCVNNKKIEIDLFKVKSSMEKIKENKENWTYTSRVKKYQEEMANE